MNLQEICFIARSQIKDLAVKKVSEHELISYVNVAKDELVSVMRQAREDYFLTSTTSTVQTAAAPNPSTVSLPSDFLELKELKITTSGYEDIDFLASDRTRTQFRNALIDGGSFGNGSGICLYDIYGNTTLMLAPGFDVALDLEITYIKDVADLHLPTDEPTDIPSSLHSYIPISAACQALRSLGDPRLSTFEAFRLEQINDVRATIQPRQVREAKYVVGFMENEEW